MKEKKRNKLTGMLIVLISAVIVVTGIALSDKDGDAPVKKSGFVTTEKRKETESASPGRFEEVSRIEQNIEITIDYNDETEATEKDETTTTKKADTSTTTKEYEYAYAGFNPGLADMDVAEWNLILVNRDYILPDGYVPKMSEAVKGSGVNLDERVAPHYQQMYDAAKADGITLVPLSGYRRVSRQKTNFENKIQSYIEQGYGRAEATQLAAQIILPPGTSEHNAGLAMDICSLDVSFENTEEFKWLCENAEDFGFILRYPKDKMEVTKITYEPWHWRYVGVGHARIMNEKGICLEEYLAMQ